MGSSLCAGDLAARVGGLEVELDGARELLILCSVDATRPSPGLPDEPRNPTRNAVDTSTIDSHLPETLGIEVLVEPGDGGDR